MSIRDELRVWTGILLVVQLIMAVGCVQLFTRMGPAIETILQENVYSLEAVEEMSLTLLPGDTREADREDRFLQALDRARSNITEPEELPVIERIDELKNPALAGDAGARRLIADALRELGEINRRSMYREDAHARAIGRTGAWGVVFLGLLAFLVSLAAMQRMMLHFLQPIEELHQALVGFEKGDLFRRWVAGDAAPEIREVGIVVNKLLERRWSKEEERSLDREHLGRLALLHLFDRDTLPTVLVDQEGTIVAANAAMERKLGGPQGEAFRLALGNLARDRGTSPFEFEVTPLSNTGWLCRLAP